MKPSRDLLERRVADLEQTLARIRHSVGPHVKRAKDMRSHVLAEVDYAQAFKFPEETKP